MSGDRRYRKSQRLDSRTIAQVLASARPRRERSVSVLWRPNGMRLARLGLIVPKRSLSRAVDRNRVRRLLREWFRNNQVRFGGQDLLLRVSGRRVDPRLLAAELARLFPGE